MIYLVDNTIDGHGASPGEIRDALARIRPDLEVLTERFSDVSLERVQTVNPSHIFLSGQSHPWDKYSAESLAGVFSVIRQSNRPILGLCGGHQQIALAFGAPVALMGRLEPGDGYAGAKRERGFAEVETNAEGIFKGMPRNITVWHSHFDEVKALPPGFEATASSLTCAIQGMQHQERPLFGVQFHPELFDDQHPDGRRVLENFLKL